MVIRAALLTMLALAFVTPAAAQTPSPLAYWQYSAGEVLAPINGPTPEWRGIVGGGTTIRPAYEGARRFILQPDVLFDVRYRDTFFLSDGEGLGVNLVHGRTYRAGIALAYDLGRADDVDGHLRGLHNISPAPEAKLFGEFALLPVIITGAVRRGIGGHDGFIADFGAYMPVPVGKSITVFLGPTVTLADSTYMKAYFGVTPSQAAAGPLPAYAPGGGLKSAGFGITAVDLITTTWFVEADLGFAELLGDAARSPVSLNDTQLSLGVHVGYRF
ncbi:MAG: structural protein MipA [Rhodospirillales bacterium]|jgi:outer membrane scaffolding protein for murein synthesis (MipA/OmpV family)|nr:structural protein MipA [Rhodospirillales bacterium]